MMDDLRVAANLVWRNLAFPITCALFVVSASMTLASGWRWAHGHTHTAFPYLVVATVLFGLLFALAKRNLRISFERGGR